MFYKQLERMILFGNEKVISINSKMNMRLDNSLPTINQLNTLYEINDQSLFDLLDILETKNDLNLSTKIYCIDVFYK